MCANEVLLLHAFVDWLFGDDDGGPEAGPASDRGELVRRALAGGFPEPVGLAGERQRESWFAAYVDTVLQRDIATLAQVEALALMPRLLSLLAARSASLLNIAELSRTAGILRSTLDRYLALLAGTFLVDLVPAWSTNLGKRLVKAPKVFVADTGLQAHLMGIDAERLRHDPHLAASLLETFVYLELAKQAGWSHAHVTIHHFRSHAGREVDLVLEDRSGRIVGIEVKAATSVGEADLAGLRALAELAGERFHRGVLLYTGDRSLPLGSRLHMAPLGAVWGGDASTARS
jgi:predicted AAA+ superfamily ATPase